MTPQPSIPDERPDPALKRLRIYAAAQGYVLVNADMLERAMGDVTGEDEDGSWAWQPERTSQREFAAAILAALTRSAQEKGQTDAD